MAFGAVLIIRFLEEKQYSNNIKKFLAISLIFSIFEYITSWVLEEIFQMRWWDYTNEFLNFEGRICLIFSILWGIIGIIFVDKIHPFIKKNVEKRIKLIDYKKQEKMVNIMLFIIGADIILSSCRYLIFHHTILL